MLKICGIEISLGEEKIFEPKELEEDEEENKIKTDIDIPETTKKALIQARRGQGKFKKNVKEIYDKCFLTGVMGADFLKASHIKPWAQSNNTERLDGNNGLLLVPHVDHLFDRGFISFESNGDVLISERLPEEIISTYRLLNFKPVHTLNSEQKKYLTYHRKKIFK